MMIMMKKLKKKFQLFVVIFKKLEFDKINTAKFL